MVVRDWLNMYFVKEYERFFSAVDEVAFNTGFTPDEVFDTFCKFFRDNRTLSDENDFQNFAVLFDAWWYFKKKFEEKHNPLEILVDYYDPSFTSEDDEVKGGFFYLKGVYVLHPMAKKISKAFTNCHFKNGFSDPFIEN